MFFPGFRIKIFVLNADENKYLNIYCSPETCKKFVIYLLLINIINIQSNRIKNQIKKNVFRNIFFAYCKVCNFFSTLTIVFFVPKKKFKEFFFKVYT